MPEKSEMKKLKHLFQPIKIGSMEVKNRIVIPGMGVGFGADDDGCPTEQLIEFMAERARGEPGMIMTGASYVHPTGTTHPSMPMKAIHLWDDKVLPGLEKLVQAVHKYDVKFGAQLNHGGLTYLPGTSYCASAIPELTNLGLELKECTKDDIKEFTDAFGSAAERCVKAGFDFVEIHGAHGYLIETFMTPFYNRRTDEYGGSFENRIRFLLEVVREVIGRVGDKIPVGVRLNGDDFIPEGSWGMEDLVKLAPILEKEGVAHLHISCGTSTYGSIDPMIAPMYVDQGARVHFAEEVKKHVSIPVITVGRVKNPIMADEIIKEGKADLVAMARAHLADPEFSKKARVGDVSDIRMCLADCLGCIENILRYGECSCTVNPRVGREYLIKEIEGVKKATAKQVLVVGAGPAGMEAARRAAFSGHEVTLCESKGWIGGQLRMATTMPKRQEIGDILDWYERQLNKLGVEIRLNTEIDETLLDQIMPDVLVTATGSLPLVPQGFVDGLENIQNIEPMMVDELLGEERLTGDTVLIVGGDQIGLQIADYLSEKGKNVYLVERGRKFATKMAQADRNYLRDRLKKKGAKTYRNVEKIEILPTDDVWMVSDNGKEQLSGIETIVFAGERRPNRFLAELAEKKGLETHIIGDALGVASEGQGTIMAAIAAGYDTGRQI
ncbi:MAG: FAD-dependent oxidoreductase [Chloroflexi bacterium]|nr:FAD-dependent oxidoreductase [Chloroflexota bacterium]